MLIYVGVTNKKGMGGTYVAGLDTGFDGDLGRMERGVVTSRGGFAG